MGKKGQSISINTIIVAAIALAVLVVLFAIFTGRLGGFTKGVQETDTCKQKCDSLNLAYVAGVDKSLANDPQKCGEGQTYIAGAYKDGEIGCCCKPKP